MPIVVGINFKKAGRVYYFDPGSLDLKENDLVIAETSRGIELGEVTITPREVDESELVAPLKRVLRLATPRDIDQEQAINQKEKEAFGICQQKIEKHELEMKLIDVEYNFDGTQGTFFFSAEGRVDFRELVKDLAQTLRIKVQLHQVGVRDEAKMYGGLGPCGRGLCCATFLSGFEPVSMKMAKEQSLFLNPAKFSGLCGKLMCCLRYEYEVYKEAKGRLPAVGSIVQTPRGSGKVVGVNVLKDTVLVDVVELGILQFDTSDLRVETPAPAVPADDEIEDLDIPIIVDNLTDTTAGVFDAVPGPMGCGNCGGCAAPAMQVSVAAEETKSPESKPPKAPVQARNNGGRKRSRHKGRGRNG